MSAEIPVSPQAPRENFLRGLSHVEIPQLGEPIKGKVRDSWIFKSGGSRFRILVTTDRQSAFDSIVCTTPGKGQVLNLISGFWFDATNDIIPNHKIEIPHPNVLIAKQAADTLPVEVIVRRYMAKSSTSTSIYHNYVDEGRRKIYGVEFPNGLKANQEFPMGNVVTPTTKAPDGQHDEELTDRQAAEIVDRKLGKGKWIQAKEAAVAIFEKARLHSLEKGLILADTKYEFGIDHNGQLMLIDEVHTPDSSRYWLANTYHQRLAEGKNPDTYDKEILRRWLAENGFIGEGPIPKINPEVIEQMSQAYKVPYQMITEQDLPAESSDVAGGVRSAVMQYFATLKL